MLWKEKAKNKQLQEFTQEHVELEKKLLPYDILGTMAHVKMLEGQGYIDTYELQQLEQALTELYKQNPDIADYEDCHTFIEEKVTEKTEAGKKIHTGRSRNDQVVTATRLLMKESAYKIGIKTVELVENLEKFAEEKNQMMPGYTHQQQAMPSSTGLWATSFADALIDDLKLLKSCYKTVNQNPLGAAASYGTSLNIDRGMTAELLGFESVQQNPIYCGNRGKQELMLLQALSHIMMDIQKMAEDLINFSEDQQVFELPEEFCTGSSIMPQKENPDALEIARAKAEEVKASQVAVQNIISKIPSGYNRDSQQTKKYLIEALELTSHTLKVITHLVEELEVSDNYELKNEIFAAYTANKKVEEGQPFREAYKEVKDKEIYQKSEEVKKPRMQCYSDMKDFWRKQEEDFRDMKSQLVN